MNYGDFTWGDGTYYGSTTYTKELDSNYTTEADLVRSTTHKTNFAVSYISTTTKRVSKFLNSIVNYISSAVKRSEKVLNSTVNYTTSTIKSIGKYITGLISYSVNNARLTSHSINYAISYLANISKSAEKAFDYLVSYSSNLARSILSNFNYIVDYSSNFAKFITRTINYTLNYLANTNKLTSRSFNYLVNYLSIAGKRFDHHVDFFVDYSTSITKNIFTILTSTVNYLATSNKLIPKILTYTVSYTNKLIKDIIDKVANSLFFYVPSYLEDDFADSLSVYGKTCVLNYNSTVPTSIALNINSLDFKSNMKGLSDSTFEIEATRSSGIKKGDYITDPDDKVYLVNWNPYKEINCLRAQVQECTAIIDFQRFQNSVMDSDGNSSTPCAYIDIAEDVYCYFNRTGMGLFDSSAGQIGIPHTQKISIGMQYNADTSLIQVSDEFTLYNKPFVITDIDYSQMNLSGNDGILVIYAQILEGGKRVTT